MLNGADEMITAGPAGSTGQLRRPLSLAPKRSVGWALESVFVGLGVVVRLITPGVSISLPARKSAPGGAPKSHAWKVKRRERLP